MRALDVHAGGVWRARWRCSFTCASPVLRDPDSNPYSVLEGKGELPDADLSEGAGGRNRKRSRRRRNDQEPSVMDAATESDGQAGPSENGLGEDCSFASFHQQSSDNYS